MKYLVSLALILAPITTVAAEDETSEWLYITNDKDGTSVYALRSDIMKGRSNQTRARVWVKLDHSRDKTTQYRESKVLYEVNCPGQSFRSLSYHSYDTASNRVYSDNTTSSITYIIPETVMESVAIELCADPAEDRRPSL